MPFNIIGASEAAPGAGTVNVAFPLDDRYARLDANDSIKITRDMKYLLGVLYAAEATGERLLVRQPGEVDKALLKCALTSDFDPTQGWEHLFKSPIGLKVDSKLEVLSVNAGDEDTLIGLILGTGYLDPGPQTIDEIINGIADTTLVANTWTACAVTWAQDLKAGKYSVVGMRGSVWLTSAAFLALMRLVIPGNPSWRPGVPAAVAEADHEETQSVTHEPYVLWGDIGVTFEAPEQMPNIECLSPYAMTDENVQLFLKKVG